MASPRRLLRHRHPVFGRGAAASQLSAANRRRDAPATAFYPGNGMTPPPQVSYQSVPVQNQIQRKTFSYDKGKKTKSLPYIPSGSFAKSMLIEGADAARLLPGMNQLYRCSCVSRSRGNAKQQNLRPDGVFLWALKPGAMSPANAPSSVPAISAVSKVIKPSISPLTATFPLWGKTGLREVVMRNGKILGWAWGPVLLTRLVRGMGRPGRLLAAGNHIC